MARGKSRSASALALMTKSLNDGAGWSPAAALSCLRSSTASSMSTSVGEHEVGRGRLRLRHPPRDGLLQAREVLRGRLAAAGLLVAGDDGRGDVLLRRLFLGGRGRLGLAARAPSPPWRAPPPRRSRRRPCAAASTSALTIRPPGPEPLSWPSSTPISRAIRFATGEALTRSPPPLPEGASACAGAGSGASSRLPLPEVSSSSSSSASGSSLARRSPPRPRPPRAPRPWALPPRRRPRPRRRLTRRPAARSSRRPGACRPPSPRSSACRRSRPRRSCWPCPSRSRRALRRA